VVFMREIRLGIVSPYNWRTDSEPLEKNEEWPYIRKRITKKYNNTCYFCGFQSEKYMEVHHKEGTWWNDSEENLVCVCPLCHACFHIGHTGMEGKGKLLQLRRPFSQTALNLKILTLLKQKKFEEIDILCQKFERYAVEDFGTDGLIETANYLIHLLNETGVLENAPEEFLFLPFIEKFSIFKYFVKKEMFNSAI